MLPVRAVRGLPSAFKGRRLGVALVGLLLGLMLVGASVAAPPAAAAERTRIPPEVLAQLPAPAEAPFPILELPPERTALTVDSVAYPVEVVQGYLEFTRGQATAGGNPRSFYEWGEILHLYDTAAERVLSARAAWEAGFRVTPDDLREFSRYTLESTPNYLANLYGGSLEVYVWDAQLQILMKKWMAWLAQGERDIGWVAAGQLMHADEAEFARWDAWFQPALARARVVTYPERLERQGEAPPRWGVALLLLAGAALVGLLVRRAVRAGRGEDLLERWNWLGWAARSRVYPQGARGAVLAVFFLMLGALAWGSTLPHRNLGSVYLWIAWWPLVPFLLFLGARSWCAVCPVATLGDLVQRIPGFGRRPPRLLAVAGIWAIEATFLAVTWFDRSVGLVSSVRLTLAALLFLLALALTVSAVYQRRTFCRYLCFFGALAGNYSMASLVELRPRSALCRGCDREACLRAAASECPMLERPRALSANRECNLCLDCVRTCERKSLVLRLRDPLAELASIRRPRLAVAGLGAILVGVVAVQNLGMLEVAGVLEREVAEATGLGKTGVTSLLYLGALGVPLLLLGAASGFRAGAAAYFGYALIPLDLGAHAAHNLLHLLGEGKAIWWVTAHLVGLSSPLDIPGGHPGGSLGAALLDTPTIKVLQITLLLVAAAGSLVVARRMQKRLGELRFLPLYGLILLLLGLNLWLFSVPMALRH